MGESGLSLNKLQIRKAIIKLGAVDRVSDSHGSARTRIICAAYLSSILFKPSIQPGPSCELEKRAGPHVITSSWVPALRSRNIATQWRWADRPTTTVTKTCMVRETCQ